MPRADDILKAYLSADNETRLHIYLQHPPLRNEFIQIDLNKKSPPVETKKTRKNHLKKSSRSGWRTSISNCCLKFRGPD